MHLPATTGYVAHALGSTEPRLNDLIRRRRIDPAPPVMLGRRLWSACHVLQAADALGTLTPAVKEAIERLAPAGGLDFPAPVSSTPAADGGHTHGR